MKNKLFFVLSISVLFFQKYSYQKSRGFCEAFIQTPIETLESLTDVSPEVLEKLKKPLKYLSCGRQCFVFESSDQSIVVKFISSKRFQKSKNQSLNELLKFELTSYKLAHSYLNRESQILAFKLGSSKNLPKVTLFDPFGIRREIDLNLAEFIIQPKAIPLKEYINKYSKLEMLEKVNNLLKNRLEADVFDKDPRIHRNIGVFNNQPFYLDLGAFYKKDGATEEEKAQEIKKILEYSKF